MDVTEVARIIHTIECPLCGAKDFDFKLRCDLGYERCLTTVQCLCCHHECEAEYLIEFNKSNGPVRSKGS